jgi:hypothetical protein
MDFLQSGTFSFTVPPGVYSLNAALVESGGNAVSSKSGKGGNLRYQNSIPVKPGQVISVKVGSPANSLTSFGDLHSDSILSSTVLGANGTAGRTVTKGGTGRSSQGGNAGGRPGVEGAGINLSTWQYTLATSSASSATAPGGGGGVTWGASDQFPTGYGGFRGAVRLIWGPNRAFPDLNISNK